MPLTATGPAGHDLEEGVYTLPVLRTFEAGGAAADELRELLGKPLTADERARSLEIVRSGDGLRQALAVGHDYAAAAATACDTLPDNEATRALRAAPLALLAGVELA